MRVVLDCLPFEDPTNEARRIVRQGMGDIIDQFDDDIFEEWLDGSPWVYYGDPAARRVETLADTERGITFCSKRFDDVETRWEWGQRQLRAKLHYSRAFYAIPHHTYIGIGEA